MSSSEDQLRAIIDTIPTLVWSTHPDGSAEFFNRRWLEYTGLSAEQSLDWCWTIALHPDDRDHVVGYWRSMLASGAPGEIEARLRRFDGDYRWFLLRVSPLRDASGDVVKWCGTNTDIHDRRRTEESERELSLIVETIPGLVWCTSPDGELPYANQRILDYLGASHDEIAQGGWVNYVHSDDRESAVAAWLRAVATGQPYEVQYRLRRADGVYRWVHVLSQLGRDSEGRATRWYGLSIDIDDRKNMEDALRTAQARLSQTTQMTTIAELAASVAHEVNQPLTAVVANGHACLRWLSARPPNLIKAHEAAERIIRDGKDAGEVVRRIRALFKRAPLDRVALDVNEVIGEVIQLLRNETVRRGVAVALDLEEDMPCVVGDRVQLQQLLLNLFLNGLEAMDPILDRPQALLVRSKRDSPETVLVEIRDAGVGLKDPERVFEAFFTTKENGMGMGLAICRSIVEAHDGRLWAVPGDGPGTTFCFTLPVQRSAGP